MKGYRSRLRDKELQDTAVTTIAAQEECELNDEASDDPSEYRHIPTEAEIRELIASILDGASRLREYSNTLNSLNASITAGLNEVQCALEDMGYDEYDDNYDIDTDIDTELEEIVNGNKQQ